MLGRIEDVDESITASVELLEQGDELKEQGEELEEKGKELKLSIQAPMCTLACRIAPTTKPCACRVGACACS